jgi:hypothetical protein
MTPTLAILGPHPFPGPDAENKPAGGIASLIVNAATLVTLPGIHFTQRLDYIKFLEQERQRQGLPPPTPEEKAAVQSTAVDLIIEGQTIQIRPDAKNMPLAFAADELLQQLVSKRRIRFLHAQNLDVQQMIRERGEYWRISPRPRTTGEIIAAIKNSRIGIGGRPIYYYNAVRGSRYLTVAEFAGLGSLAAAELREHLIEIQAHSAQCNRQHYPDIDFFKAAPAFNSTVFAAYDFANADETRLRAWHAELLERFRQAVPKEFHQDEITNLIWRKHMFLCLMEERKDTVLETLVPCCTPEFFRQIQWLPGGRIEDGELVFDSIFGEWEQQPDDAGLNELCDAKVKGFICNYIREFGTLQYVNIGRLTSSMRRHVRGDGHCAYIAEVKHRGAPEPVVRILRVQRWGIREHLNDNRDLLTAILEAEEYTEYTLDRRLGCWQLGMPLPGSINPRRIREIYRGTNYEHYNTRIWTTYYERNFIEGVATDKIPPERFRERAFALAFARLLGRAAAPNMVVGRTTLKNSTGDVHVLFDSGDEMLILDPDSRQPACIVVADHTGTFNEYDRPLASFAEAYAAPIRKRCGLTPDPEAFAETYITALADALRGMQDEYRGKKRAFDTLFKESKQGEGTFSWRWAKALERLLATDVDALAETMRRLCAPAVARPLT